VQKRWSSKQDVKNASEVVRQLVLGSRSIPGRGSRRSQALEIDFYEGQY
jgi:hypothetical protein